MKSAVQVFVCLLSLTACANCQNQKLEDVIDKLEKFAEENLPSDVFQLLKPSDRTSETAQSSEAELPSASQKRLAAYDSLKKSLRTGSDDSDEDTRVADNRVFAYNTLPRNGERQGASVGRLAAYNAIQKKLKTGKAQKADNRVFAYNTLPRKSGLPSSDEEADDDGEQEVAPAADNRVFAYNTLPKKSGGVPASQLRAYNSIKSKLQQKGDNSEKSDNRVFAYNSVPQIKDRQ